MSWQIAVVIAIEALAIFYLGWRLWPRAAPRNDKPHVPTKDLLKKRNPRV